MNIISAVVSFFNMWYNEGIYTMPPPCFFSKTFRYLFSENPCGGPFACVKVAKWGTEWGMNNRSKVMFWAFWVSFIGMVLHTYTFFSLSTDPQIIKSVHWIHAELYVDKYDSTRKYYAGSRVLITECSTSKDPLCQHHSEDWLDSDVCDERGSYCPDCADVATSTISMAFFGLVAMIPQILINLQRSTEAGDFNFQKWIGQAAAIVATVSTVISLVSCYTGCYRKLEDGLEDEGNDVDIFVGSAYWSIVLATILKPFDFWAHWVVPVPAVHWDPSHPEYWDEQHRLSDVGTKQKIKKSIVLPIISKNMSASVEDIEKCLEEGGEHCEGLQVAPILGGVAAPSIMGMDVEEDTSNTANSNSSSKNNSIKTRGTVTLPMKLKPGFHPNSSMNVNEPTRVLSKYGMSNSNMLDCFDETEVVEDKIGSHIDLKALINNNKDNNSDTNSIGPDLCNGCDVELYNNKNNNHET